MIISKVLELTYTSSNLKDFAKDLKYSRDPFIWDVDRRMKIKSELDAIFFHLYKIEKKGIAYILDTFKKLKKKELEEFNEFRTKKLVLGSYAKFSKQKELFE